jgi:hypothetical protein
MSRINGTGLRTVSESELPRFAFSGTSHHGKPAEAKVSQLRPTSIIWVTKFLQSLWSCLSKATFAVPINFWS